ncbi:MAG: zinc ribbon domain-containing protein [Eubacteriales bacterium]|jgi:hypothetical protein
MKSIKPGRGPSMMGGVMSLLVGLGGVFWTLTAFSSGAPIFFCLFGVVFVVIAVVQAWYQFHNATQKNRWSSFDITDSQEEPDPLQQAFQEEKTTPPHQDDPVESRFCPYCGAPVQPGFQFCNRCGRPLP